MKMINENQHEKKNEGLVSWSLKEGRSKERSGLPSEILQVDVANLVSLQTQFHQAVHLVESFHALDTVTVCAEFAQMAEAFQLFGFR